MFNDTKKGYSQNRGGYNARSGMRGRKKEKKIEDTITNEAPETKPENELAEITETEPKVIETPDEI